ncbi:MAG TPA: SBBP repeat-containing protein, partial [Candidatus Acidoferrales bacterium]|nr:SBBP repeat-containing protein [Candidatus Acidoferrales bacterium]
MRRDSFFLGASLLMVLGWALLVKAEPPASTSRGAGSERAKSGRPGIPAPRAPLSGAAKRRAIESFGKLPLYFEANVGQTNPAVKFLSRGPAHALLLTPSEMVLVARGKEKAAAIQMKLAGGNSSPNVSGMDPLPGHTNYFIGNDPTQWHTNVQTYAKVRYESVYPGIDLIYHGNQQRLEYDFVVAPGADPRAIRMKLDGAEKLEITAGGDLVLHAGGTEVTYRKPVVYQPETGSRADGKQFVEGHYVHKGEGEVAFEVPSYDPSRPLVIDPTVGFSTYLGGGLADGAFAVVSGFSGIYVTGGTTSTPTTMPPFPIKGDPTAYQPTFGGAQASCTSAFAFECGDAFVTVFDFSGTSLVFSTYIGGSSKDEGRGIAVDINGNVYISGTTNSANFPTMNGLPAGFEGTQDAFVAELNSSGSALEYSTLLGGTGGASNTGLTEGYALALDSSNNVYVTGATNASDFPTTTGVVQTTCTSCTQTTPQSSAFVSKFNTTMSGTAALLYSTFLGGTKASGAFGIAVDSSNNAYVAGSTIATDFPLMPSPNPIQPGGFGGGGTACGPILNMVCGDGFVTKLNSTATAMVYSTYLGGSGEDGATGVAVDSSGNAYISGGTDTNNATAANKFPVTPGSFQTTFGGGSNGCTMTGGACGDAFLVKINPAGNALVYGTYIGGSGDDLGFGVQVDAGGNAYITGVTDSTDFPTTANALQTSGYGGGTAAANCTNSQLCGDAFLVVLDPTGARQLLSTYLGGSGDDAGIGLSISAGNAYLSGFTNSNNFPTTAGVAQTTYGGGASDAFVVEYGIYQLFGCTDTFTGGAGTTDWGTPLNWSTGLLP